MKKSDVIQLKSKKTTANVICLLIFLMGFLTIVYFVASSAPEWQVSNFDTSLRDAILGLRCGFLSAILIPITYSANWETITFLCIITLFFKRTRMKYGIPLSIAAICATLVQTYIKQLVQRPRPDAASFLIEQGGYSFPSAHSSTSLVFYFLMAYLIWRYMKNRKMAQTISVACCCLPLLIGFSRIYLGVHYPTDVLGGWLLGGILLIVFLMVYEKWFKVVYLVN